MNKKFSIVNTIDLNKLCDEIDRYTMQTGETNMNIFMHIDTINAIYKHSPFSLPHIANLKDKNDAIAYWESNKIFIDNNLEFGEIEIKPLKCKCEHEWHIVGSVAGTKARYRVFVCSKCGEQQTERQVFDKENGTYEVFILDYENI